MKIVLVSLDVRCSIRVELFIFKIVSDSWYFEDISNREIRRLNLIISTGAVVSVLMMVLM